MAPSRRAWLTLATNDTYCMGALVTGNSLRNVNTEAELVVFITDQVTSHMKKLLAEVYDHIKNVDIIEGSDHDLLLDTSRPEWAVCMTKILGWRLTQYEKIVYIDSDAIAIKNCDELFDKPELSAVTDISWPDIFNSGVFVFEPNEKTFQELLELTTKNVSFDRADQGLLNVYFSNWFNEKEKHLSAIYNAGTIAAYSYQCAWRRFGHKVKIIHFLGGLKPWEYGYDPVTKAISNPPNTRQTQMEEHLQLWWDLFAKHVQPKLDSTCSGLAGKLSQVDLSEKTGSAITGVAGLEKKQATSHYARADYPWITPPSQNKAEKSIGG